MDQGLIFRTCTFAREAIARQRAIIIEHEETIRFLQEECEKIGHVPENEALGELPTAHLHTCKICGAEFEI